MLRLQAVFDVRPGLGARGTRFGSQPMNSPLAQVKRIGVFSQSKLPILGRSSRSNSGFPEWIAVVRTDVASVAQG